MNEHRNGRRRGLVAVVLSAAAVAVALPVSGALAGGDSRDDSPRNHDGDCPDRDRQGGSGSDASVEL
jgi:hypothetical protein